MTKTGIRCCIFMWLFFGITPLLAQQDVFEQLEDIAIIDQKVMMPMRDGVRLATDIYRPKTDKKVPIIFSRTPYNFNSWGDGERRTRTAQRALEYVKMVMHMLYKMKEDVTIRKVNGTF